MSSCTSRSDEIVPLIEPMVVGSIPVGLAVGCIVYFIVYKAVAAYQDARRKRLADRRQAARRRKPGRSCRKRERIVTKTAHLRLGVNIDHVATVRNARGGRQPDPVRAALLAEKAGADGITAHLREDRRHITDRDITRLSMEIALPLNLEMAATDEMLAIALRHRPHAACLVPERREERTTEGGLDAAGGRDRLQRFVGELGAAGIRVSLFIEPERRQLDAAKALGAPVVELHTGAYCESPIEGDEAATRAPARAARRGGAPWALARPGGACRARARLRHGEAGRRHSGACRAQHRPFPHRRGDLRRARGERARHARADGRGAGWSGGRGLMIVGIGSDLIDIRRVEKSAGALRRALHPADLYRHRAAEVGGPAAARRLLCQALRRQGGLRQGARHRAQGQGVFWRDMGVVNLRSGKPTMALTGGAAERLAAIMPAGSSPVIHLTITDEWPLAQAFVIIEAVAGPQRRRNGAPMIDAHAARIRLRRMGRAVKPFHTRIQDGAMSVAERSAEREGETGRHTARPSRSSSRRCSSRWFSAPSSSIPSTFRPARWSRRF